MNEQQIREIIRQEISLFMRSDRFTFQKDIQMLDGRNVQLATETGTKIGTATGQKIGFWNVTPVIQPSSANEGALSLNSSLTGANTLDKAKTELNFSQIQTLVNQLRSDLVAVGIIKGSA